MGGCGDINVHCRVHDHRTVLIQRDDIRVVVDGALAVRRDKGDLLLDQDQQFTFINSGNRAAVITEIYGELVLVTDPKTGCDGRFANPTSVRQAFLAAVAVFHATDYLSGKPVRDTFRKNADFVVVDRIAHAFKHVRTRDPKIPTLSANEVIARPPMDYASQAYGLSRYGDLVGGVTLEDDRQLDVLSVIKRAAEFIRLQIEARPAGP
ncbi:hypothetical protein GGD66_006989 [Bradyrhizobium sp. CIR48]|nr:hypothetical protein [Bradyrhizobium sp. CIR48]